MDIRSLAEKGYDLAANLADQAWKTVTVRMNPERSAYDPITELSTTSWVTETTVSALKYSEQKMITNTNKSSDKTEDLVDYDVFLVKASDLGYVDADTKAEIEFAGRVYSIQSVSADPVGATYKFSAAR